MEKFLPCSEELFSRCIYRFMITMFSVRNFGFGPYITQLLTNNNSFPSSLAPSLIDVQKSILVMPPIHLPLHMSIFFSSPMTITGFIADDTINWNLDPQSSSSDQSPQQGIGNTGTDDLESGPTGAETRLRGRRRNRSGTSLMIFMFVLIVFHVIFIVIAISFWKMWDVPSYPEVVL